MWHWQRLLSGMGLRASPVLWSHECGTVLAVIRRSQCAKGKLVLPSRSILSCILCPLLLFLFSSPLR